MGDMERILLLLKTGSVSPGFPAVGLNAADCKVLLAAIAVKDGALRDSLGFVQQAHDAMFGCATFPGTDEVPDADDRAALAETAELMATIQAALSGEGE